MIPQKGTESLASAPSSLCTVEQNGDDGYQELAVNPEQSDRLSC